MAGDPVERGEVFPKGSSKSFALVELVRGETPMVDRGPEDTEFSFPVVLLWEILLLLGVTLTIFVFSLFKQAPLEEIANPFVTTDPAKAPWYFVGLQELLEHMHPTLAGVVIPTLLVGFMVLLPYLDPSRQGAGIWFTSRRGARIVLWTALYTLVAMPAYILIDNTFSARELLRPIAAQWVGQGLVPGGTLLLLTILPGFLCLRLKVSRRELVMTVFTVLFVAAMVFTVSGFLFRGPGFKLFWPWRMPEGYTPWNDL